MATRALVEAKISAGRRLLELLDINRFLVRDMAWFYYDEADNWTLIISTPETDHHSLTSLYLGLISILAQMRIDFELSLNEIAIEEATESLTRLLQPLANKFGIAGSRLSKSAINGVYVEDVYVYRALRSRLQTYGTFDYGTQIVPPRDATYRLEFLIYPPAPQNLIWKARRPRSSDFAPGTVEVLHRIFAITDEAATALGLRSSRTDLLDVWSFLDEQGNEYTRRLIDLLVSEPSQRDRIPIREFLLQPAESDFGFATMTDAQILEPETAPLRV